MHIENAQIALSAQQEVQTQQIQVELFNMAPGVNAGANSPSGPPAESPPTNKPVYYISPVGTLLAEYRAQQKLELGTPMDAKSKLNLMIIKAMYEAITGKSLRIAAPATGAENKTSTAPDEGTKQAVASTREVSSLKTKGAIVRPQLTETSKLALSSSQLDVNATPPRRLVASPAVVYERRTIQMEQEAMSFQAQGVVQTQDGRSIDIAVALNMSRQFVQETVTHQELRVNTGQKIDPLVINFDGLGAELSQTRFAFDLDSDGTPEQLASLRPNSGYLALDRNGDGQINNGTELFGPSTGQGFAELAAYDEDGNNFIDEADSIYSQLRIWTMQEDGSSQLVALGDKKIGAIYLGHVTSPFQLNDASNQSLGEVKNSSIFIGEEGNVGIVQEIDLRV